MNNFGSYSPLRLLNNAVRNFCDWRQRFSACELSTEVSNVLLNASRFAKEAGSSSVESEFILKAVLESGSPVTRMFRSISGDRESLTRQLDGYIRSSKYSRSVTKIGTSTSSALLYAQSVALSRGKSVGIPELEEGLIKYDSFLQSLKNKKHQTDSPIALASDPACLHDLTNDARCGRLGPFVGREAELERLKGTLARMRKNNVLIVGPAGVGKTALVEQLAVELSQENESVTVMSLNLCALYSGQGFRGELESKLKAIFDAIKDSKTILFIDEIHHLIENQEAGTNLTNLFKPLMTRDDVKIIGATTSTEYHRYFRQDRAFERRFELLKLAENTFDETLVILHRIRPEFEAYHNVVITDDALMASVELARRFIPRSVLPDKAIDVLDEAAMLAKYNSSIEHQVERALRRIRNSLLTDMLRNGNQTNTKKLVIENIDSQLVELKSLQQTLKKQERKLQELHRLRKDHEKDGELLKASELCNHTIPEQAKNVERLTNEKSKKIRQSLETISSFQGSGNEPNFSDAEKAMKLEVDRKTIAKVVSRKVGVPVEVLLHQQQNKYTENLEKLRSVVIGQDEAIRRALLHFYKQNCGFVPLNGFSRALCFLGPPDVGKHILLRNIAEMLGMALRTLNSSQLQASTAINILLGSPPGYVGHREGGILSEWIKESPYTIIVLEEAELMHTNVANLLASAIEKGFFLDNHGEECRLDQAFIVFCYRTEKEIHDKVRVHVDEVVQFKELDRETVKKIIRSKLSEIPLVNLRYTEPAVEHLCHLGNYTCSALKALNSIIYSGICQFIASGELFKHETCRLLLRSEATATDATLPISEDLVLVKEL